MILARRPGALVGVLLLSGCGHVDVFSRFPSPAAIEPPPQDPQLPDKRRHVRIEGDAPEWDPLTGPLRRFKEALAEDDVDLEFDATILNQWASDTDRGKSDLVTLSYELNGSWKIIDNQDLGKGSLGWSVLGSEGLNYSIHKQTCAGNVGSISLEDLMLQPDPVIVNELTWTQSFEDGRTILALGKIDLSSYFDTNRVANRGFSQFLAGSMENNPSIPFPLFGGFGGVLKARLGEPAYLMVGMADSSMNKPVLPWDTVDNDSWYQMFELGIRLEPEALGKGNYRLIPWHNRIFNQDGWGFALSFDQELGVDRLVGFFRAGVGDDSVVAIETFLSGGVAIEGPFDRPHDLVGLGVSWSEPSPAPGGSRSETILETFYRFQLSPTLQFSPDVQVLFNPTNGTEDTVVLLNLRLNLLF
jgi:carbohydrate-selective porin OprB